MQLSRMCWKSLTASVVAGLVGMVVALLKTMHSANQMFSVLMKLDWLVLVIAPQLININIFQFVSLVGRAGKCDHADDDSGARGKKEILLKAS